MDRIKTILVICILTVMIFDVIAQKGIILEGNSTVLDPNGDGFVSKTDSGFSDDGYDVDEFEIPMFGIPIFADGEALHDIQAGEDCGVTDIAVDTLGFGVYGAIDDLNNLIFRFRLAGTNPSVEAYSILIDTDQAVGEDDPNSNSENPGFEIAITYFTKQDIRIFDIDGQADCPAALEIYPLEGRYQHALAGSEACDDEDYFYDFFVPFDDLNTHFGITSSSLLRFVAVTNISATCPVDGTISDIGGVDDTDYEDCPTCAFFDLTSSQCPTPIDSLCASCGGFPDGFTEPAEIDLPVNSGDVTISGTSEPSASVYIDVFDGSGTLVNQDTTKADTAGVWVSNPFDPPMMANDSIVVTSLASGKCLSGLSGSGIDYTIVGGNNPPEIEGSLTALGYIENSGAVQVDTAITIEDPDNTMLVSADVWISNNYNSGEDSLGFADQSGITGLYDPGSATWTLTGNATLTDYEDALRSITYTNSSEDPDIAIRTVSFRVNDGVANSNEFSRQVIIAAINDPPVILIGGVDKDSVFISTDEDVPLEVTLDATDIENDSIFVSEGLSLTGKGIITPHSSDPLKFIYTPELDFNGDESLKLYVCDNGDPSACDSLIVMASVNPVNDAPVIIEDSVAADTVHFTVDEDVTLNFCITVTDVENDKVVISSFVENPGNGNVSMDPDDSLCLVFTPDANFNGTEYFDVTVTDDGIPNRSDTAVVEITVMPVNDPPVITESGVPVDTIRMTINEDETVDICIEATDIDGDNVFVNSARSVDGIGGITDEPPPDLCFTYVPEQDFSGVNILQVIACDDGTPSLCDTAYVELTILDVDDPPVAVNDTINAVEDTDAAGNVLANDYDPDGDGLVLNTTPVSSPGNGTVTINTDGSFTYRSNEFFEGQDSFTYEVCDDTEPVKCDQALVVINVEAKPLEAFQAVSPNGDGFNDIWIIQGIQRYPNNTVQIFDRWDNMVYEAQGYDNVNIIWTGHSNTGIRSRPLPEGTYFYVIYPGDGSPRVKGFLVLKR